MKVVNHSNNATFVMPHWIKKHDRFKIFLDKAVESILNQTDENWHLIIIDDHSPSKKAREYLHVIKEKYPKQIFLKFENENKGAGYCRNIGIEWALQNKSPYILFNDIDDMSHPKRLEICREIFLKDAHAGVVYSTFKVIDEYDNVVKKEELTPSILEILESHNKNSVSGYDCWKRIGTETGYTNLTSSTAVRTDLAYKHPFPIEKVSEDCHTWFRYAADTKFIYSPQIPTLYRIPNYINGSAVRERFGKNFYREKARVDEDGFKKTIQIALKNKSIDGVESQKILLKFYFRLYETLIKENEILVASDIIKKCEEISPNTTHKFIEELKNRGIK